MGNGDAERFALEAQANGDSPQDGDVADFIGLELVLTNPWDCH
ncbi:hypothetical protein [Candidatus Palauibacter sp.]